MGGFRSHWGAEAYTIVASMLDTVRKRGEDVFYTLLSFLGLATPILMATLPDQAK